MGTVETSGNRRLRQLLHSCVHGLGPAAWPHGRRRHSTRRACEEILARAHNSRDDRKKLQNVFCCVTTHGARRCRQSSRLGPPPAQGPETPSVSAAGVPPPRVAGVLPGGHGVSAVAWLPASCATPSDTQALGSSVGCAAAPETSVRSLCGDKSATPAADLSRACRLRWYAEVVPWEVTTPWGSPGRMSVILLGHSALDALFLWSPCNDSCRDVSPRKSEGKQERQARCCDGAGCNEGNKEGNAGDAFLPGRRPRQEIPVFPPGSKRAKKTR